jgi:hypothetical protein
MNAIVFHVFREKKKSQTLQYILFSHILYSIDINAFLRSTKFLCNDFRPVYSCTIL